METDMKSQLHFAMFHLGNIYRFIAFANEGSNATKLHSAISELAWAYVHLLHEEGNSMNKIEAIKRTEEGIVQLDNLVRLLRDEDPDQAGRIHIWCNTLRELKDQWMDELDETEGNYGQVQDYREAACGASL